MRAPRSSGASAAGGGGAAAPRAQPGAAISAAARPFSAAAFGGTPPPSVAETMSLSTLIKLVLATPAARPQPSYADLLLVMKKPDLKYIRF